MRYKLLIILAINAVFFANAQAGDIVTWQDDEGVTHFGNSQFAPLGASEVVVKPANGMHVPANTSTRSTRSDGPHVVTVNRAARKNKRGFRGFRARTKGNSRSRRRY